MIGSITPLVQEAFGTQRWSRALLAYAMGSIAGSTLVGGTLGLVGHLAGGPWPWGGHALLIMALILGLKELGLYKLPTGPMWRRQTPKRWQFRNGAAKTAFMWGLDLGLGVTTRVNYASYWLLVAACLLLAQPLGAAALLGGYGLGRTILVATGPLLVHGRASVINLNVPFLHRQSAWHSFHGWVLLATTALLLLDGIRSW